MTREPLDWFREWLAEAGDDSMVLATASADGAPSARMVLLKQADERGFVFFTNYASRKGRELAENPRAALLFHHPGRVLRPHTYEFWVHGEDRLHDRVRFRRDGDAWVSERLAP